MKKFTIAKKSLSIKPKTTYKPQAPKKGMYFAAKTGKKKA